MVSTSMLCDIRDEMDFIIDEISYTQKTRLQIPCGYMGNNLFLKSFDDIFNESDATYLRSLYAKHHELYEYEIKMIDVLANLRAQYDDIESALFTQEAVADAKARGIIPAEDGSAPSIGEGSDSYDEDDAFGERMDWIA
jgi:hypothetical protein